jgi:thiol-disulfide isomerase/thioredoxin
MTQMAARGHLLIIAAMAAAAFVLLLFLGIEYGPQVLSPGKAVRQPAPADFAGSGSANSSVVSVFDQPRGLPEVRFQDDQGHDLTLADFRGRVVLLNVWATWCVPCRQEMPTLDRLQARLGGKDFLVMALSIDRKGAEAVRGFYREVGVEKLAIYVDSSGKGSRSLAIPGVPTTLLIDREGREVARKMGEAQWDSPEMVSLVETTMRGQSARNADDAR